MIEKIEATSIKLGHQVKWQCPACGHKMTMFLDTRGRIEEVTDHFRWCEKCNEPAQMQLPRRE